MARVAIEFDNNQIFLAAMQTASRRSQLKHVACLETDGTTEAITNALREKINAEGLAKSDACVVVRRDDVELRLLNVPPAPPNELPGIVKFLAKNEFASLNENWLLDFVRLSGGDDTPGRVMAAGLSPEKKKRIENIVEGAGLRLRNIEFRPYAVAKYLADKLSQDRTIVVVEPMGEQAEITLYQGTSIIAVRKFKLTGNDKARLLEREVKRTIAAESTALNGESLATILLLGDTEQLQPYGQPLAEALESDFQIVDPALDRFYGGQLKGVESSNRFAALVGALNETESTRVAGLDFLNPRKPIVEKQDYSKWKMYGWIAAAALVLMFGFGWWMLSNQSKEIEDLRISLAKITAINEGDENRTAVADTLKEVGEIDKWVTGATNWQENLLIYSEHALTADDAIVDRLEGRTKSKTNSVSIGIETRAADNRAEAALVEELSKAFDVIPGKSELLDGDEYKAQSNLTVTTQIKPEDKVKQIDAQAEKFLNSIRKANAAAASKQVNK
jgi:Tfp pilus assembly PilM family ATPase